ncbi:MAG: LysR family transcriptional regulator [Acidimicrobiales bacterium]
MRQIHESLDRGHIELLVALHNTGRLSLAAEVLSLSPSAASHRLKEAERRLGIVLTTVEGRSIRLTPAAVHVAEVGELTRSAMRAAEETARWMTSAARPAVRIALDFYDTAPWFEELVGLDDLPCDVDFVRVGFDAARHAVNERRADLGIVVVRGDAPAGDFLVHDELVGLVRVDHAAAKRGVLDPLDIEDAIYLTAGDRPTHGFEHHEFFEPAGVHPYRLRKVESLAMILRLMRKFGGVTVQPYLSLAAAPLDGLAMVPLRDTQIAVRWEIARRQGRSEDEVAMVEAIRGLAEGHSGRAI